MPDECLTLLVSAVATLLKPVTREERSSRHVSTLAPPCISTPPHTRVRSCDLNGKCLPRQASRRAVYV